MYLNSIYICLKDAFNVIYHKHYFIKVINSESVVIGVKAEEDSVICTCTTILVYEPFDVISTDYAPGTRDRRVVHVLATLN